MNKHSVINNWARRHLKLIASVMFIVTWASCAKFQLREGWNENLGPIIPHDTFPADCSLCHISTNWDTLRDDFEFDHEAQTGVALTGSHAQAQCLLCHNDRGPVAGFAEKGCAGCHIDVHMGRLGNECESCHNENTWRPLDAIANHNRTRFPLIGAHTSVECFFCHEGAESGVFLATDINCVACHLDDYQATTMPNHAASGFSTNCQDCHVAVAWQGINSLSHPSTFPLAGGHAGLACTMCHSGGVFTGLSTACVSCHLTDYNMTTNPNHVVAGFPTTCENCHNINTWTNAVFNHSYPIIGPHSNFDCIDCHTTGVFPAFSCTVCHLMPKTDGQHTGVPGYIWASASCLACHPNGLK